MTKLGKVLVVDDDSVSRFVTIMTLRQTNVTTQISEAEDGRTALWLLQKESFDLILLDLRMPVLDGFVFLDLVGLTQKEAGMVVPAVVVLSTLEASWGKARIKQYPMVKGRLTKPLLPWHLPTLFGLLEKGRE